MSRISSLTPNGRRPLSDWMVTRATVIGAAAGAMAHGAGKGAVRPFPGLLGGGLL